MTDKPKKGLLLSEMFPSQFMSAPDLRGKEFTLLIEKIEDSEVKFPEKRDKEDKYLVTFKGAEKQMVLNSTNTRAIAVLLCHKFPISLAEAIGKRVVLGIDTDLDRDKVPGPCLRVIGSPDATPERAALFKRTWEVEDRQGGKFVKRLKRELRQLESAAAGRA